MAKTVMPVIDKEKCKGCGLCASVCSCGALIVIESVVTVIETESCGWCTQCEAVCPNQAISCGYLVIIEG